MYKGVKRKIQVNIGMNFRKHPVHCFAYISIIFYDKWSILLTNCLWTNILGLKGPCYFTDRSDELIAMGTNWNPPPSSNTNVSSNAIRNGRGQQAASTSSNNLLMPVASRKSVTTRGPMLAPAKNKHGKTRQYTYECLESTPTLPSFHTSTRLCQNGF